MIKVLMIAPCPYDLDRIKGGVESVTVNLLRGFEMTKNIDLRIVSINKEIKNEKTISFSNHISIQYVPFGRFNSTKINKLFHGRRRIIEIIKEFKPKIVHLQGNGSSLLSTIGLNKDMLILTQHGILKEESKYQEAIIDKLSYYINLITEYIILRNIKNVIFISNYNRKLFVGKKNKIKSKLIYNPVNEKFFNLESTPENNKLLYVGSISKLKGLMDLLNVLYLINKKKKKYHLDIVGGVGDLSYKKKIDDFIKSHKLENDVTFYNWLSQTEIQELLISTTILVHPSYQEVLPVTIAEAMAAGKVVVATKIGGIPEMIVDGVTGFLFDKGNTKELKEILEKLYLKPDKIKAIGKMARERAYNMFYPSNIAKETLAFYKEILKSNAL